LRRERPDHTLQPTALINELFLLLVRQRAASAENRTHFFALSAQLMRRILVDHARSRDADQARIVERRFFAGLTVEESALVLDRSPRTIKREWRLARAWLARELATRTFRWTPLP
jgi:DNA-directed RNA polymerase specialized sigma24 family protein